MWVGGGCTRQLVNSAERLDARVTGSYRRPRGLFRCLCPVVQQSTWPERPSGMQLLDTSAGESA